MGAGVETLIWLLPALPLASFIVLAFAGRRISRTAVAVVGLAPVAAATCIATAVAVGAAFHPEVTTTVVLWRWIAVDGFEPAIAFRVDSLSVVMSLVVTFVSTLILLYSTRYMDEDEGYSRFFAYMNLFVASMLVLVLAEDLLLLYLGWEGVGLCSYLLIGFWYRDSANGRAARKAFIVTRVGDAALAIGLFLIFANLGTLEITGVLERAPAHWATGSTVATWAALLLLGGAVGKSAQLPLQTWLPDAMAGPTPVSALIHAATMVTAGVYLIARMHVLFMLAPAIMALVAILGAATLLLSAFSALSQRDIKRVLAYSTMSQIGYMFLALGVGAWSAAIFHLMTHACFKALLFLASGVVIHALGGEHDLHAMGGLRRRLPYAYWTFVAAGGALAGFPLVSAGFFSKDLILWRAWQVSPVLWACGLAGVLLTALYIFRLIFLAFHGPVRKKVVGRRPNWAIKIPLVVLAVLSVGAGWFELPDTLGNVPLVTTFLHATLPAAPFAGVHDMALEGGLETVSSLMCIAGIAVAYLVFVRYRDVERGWPGVPASVERFWRSGLGFDWAYERAFVRPFVAMCRVARNDAIDAVYRGIEAGFRFFNGELAATESGRVRAYAAAAMVGAAVLLALGMLT